MESAARHPGQGRRRLRRLHMHWGTAAALEVVTLALLSAYLVMIAIPSAFDVEWGCVGRSGGIGTSADTYIDAFAVGGALSWLVVAALAAATYTSSRPWVALVIPAVWFAVLTGTALAVASSIGPLPC